MKQYKGWSFLEERNWANRTIIHSSLNCGKLTLSHSATVYLRNRELGGRVAGGCTFQSPSGYWKAGPANLQNCGIKWSIIITSCSISRATVTHSTHRDTRNDLNLSCEMKLSPGSEMTVMQVTGPVVGPNVQGLWPSKPEDSQWPACGWILMSGGCVGSVGIRRQSAPGAWPFICSLTCQWGRICSSSNGMVLNLGMQDRSFYLVGFGWVSQQLRLDECPFAEFHPSGW